MEPDFSEYKLHFFPHGLAGNATHTRERLENIKMRARTRTQNQCSPILLMAVNEFHLDLKILLQTMEKLCFLFSNGAP